MPIEIDETSLSAELGAARPVRLPATRYYQGRRVMYHITTALAQLPQIIVKRPDPDYPIEGNRRVDANRARRFGDYLIEQSDWVSPAIIVRAPEDISFVPAKEFEDGTSWGELTIPLDVLTEILLLDGQHRTLGAFDALEKVNTKIRDLRNRIDGAEANGNEGVVSALKADLSGAFNVRERFTREHLSVDIAVVTTDRAKQMFADINNNSKGVNPDFTTVLDQRSAVNRIAHDLIESHPLLKDRVELGQSSRMSKSNPNLVGAKTVADLVRSVHVGVAGRVGVRVENELSLRQVEAVEEVAKFLDVLVAGFEELQAVMDGQIDPIDLRLEHSENRSMIGSASMLRALGGFYHEVIKESPGDNGPEPMSRSQIEVYFRKLAPKLREIPIAEDNEFWLSTEAFIPGTAAPQARQGTLTALVRHLVTWARDGDASLDSAD